MKRVLRLVSLGTIAVTTATTVLSQDFDDAEAAKNYFAEEAKEWKARLERIRNALADDNDVILKEEIFNLASMIGYTGIHVDALQGLLDAGEIPPERVAKILKNVIQTGLPILKEAPDKDVAKRNKAFHDVFLTVTFLQTIPSEDTLTLLKEISVSNEKRIRKATIETTGKIIKKLEEKKQPADVEKFATFLKEMKQAEGKREN